MEFKWNKNCTTVLVSAFAEKPDKTSYYGQTMLYLLSSKTQEAVVVEFREYAQENFVFCCDKYVFQRVEIFMTINYCL